MKLSDSIRRLFAETRIVEHPDDYVIVGIDVMEEAGARRLLGELNPFSSITFDREEVSVVLKHAEWEALRGDFSSAKEAGPYRLITFDIFLDLSIVGFLSAVSTLLAEEGISIYALSTYLKDHILVKTEDAERAVGALQRLVENCKRNLRATGQNRI